MYITVLVIFLGCFLDLPHHQLAVRRAARLSARTSRAISLG
jgi:hypothetical protein